MADGFPSELDRSEHAHLRIGSLFAGIGGFDLAARWMGWETAWYSEIEPYACRVMARHFPEATNLGDITKITGAPAVDMLVGGFPCQDISLAGKGAGIDGERSGLWKHYARLIGELRPRWVVAENVSALRSRGLDVVLQDLDALGYDAEWHCIPASYVGAPHQRDRIWIIAHPHADDTRLEGRVGEILRERAGERAAGPVGACVAQQLDLLADVADAARERREQGDPLGGGCGGGSGAPGRDGIGSGRSGGWWDVEPDVGRVAHGVPGRVDRLRCLGNAVVPWIPYMIFQAIDAAEREVAA